MDRLTVTFQHDGAARRTTLDLGLLDPNGFRGWSGGAKSAFTVAATDATPAYVPGPLPAGRWTLLIGVPNARPGSLAHYHAEIRFHRTGDPRGPFNQIVSPSAAGPAWYAGDFHSHTGHSDGTCKSRRGRTIACPSFRLLEAADRAGFDFLVVTDHNAASTLQDLRALQPYFDRTLLIPGREITTFWGHAGAIGVEGFVDFRLRASDQPFDPVSAAVRAEGGLLVINHPGAPSGEACMGCGWTAPFKDLSLIDAVEVMNGGQLQTFGDPLGPLTNLPFWTRLLDQGYRPTAVGGSDIHDPDAEGRINRPTTYVYATSLDQAALLAAVRAGHVYIDAAGPDHGREAPETAPETAPEKPPGEAPARLTFGLADGSAMMGDEVRPGARTPLALRIGVTGVPRGRLALLTDAALKVDGPREAPADGAGVLTAVVRPDGRPHWALAEVFGPDGRLRLLSNPIYIDRRTREGPDRTRPGQPPLGEVNRGSRD